MFKATDLSLTYGTAALFSGVRLTLNPGDRFALVGPNGAGKSSLLKILAGLADPDRGIVDVQGEQIGYVGQEVAVPDKTLGSYLLDALGPVYELHLQLQALGAKMADSSKVDAAMAEYGKVLTQFEELDGWSYQVRLETVTTHLGIDHIDPNRMLRRLSGGEQSRVLMAGALLTSPTILLLDEPTNHLDADGIAWLSKFLLEEFKGAVLVISHDRTFLNETVTRIYELDGLSDELQVFEGNYKYYQHEKKLRYEALVEDYEQQERERRKINRDVRRIKDQTKNEHGKNDYERARLRKHARRAKVQAARLERHMALVTWIARPERAPVISLKLAGASEHGRRLLKACDIGLTVAKRPLLTDFDLTVHGGDRILITGVNGSGKTMLLRALTGEIQPTKGSVERFCDLAYLPQLHDDLPLDTTVLQFFRYGDDNRYKGIRMFEEDARNWLNRFLFEHHQLGQPIRNLSAGERTRLKLAIILLSGAELLILDEPTNYLDFASLDVIEDALRKFRGTLIYVTHDQYFADKVGWTTRVHISNGHATTESHVALGHIQRD